MTRDGSDFGYLLSIETDDSGTLSLSGSGQIDGGKLNGTAKSAAHCFYGESHFEDHG